MPIKTFRSDDHPYYKYHHRRYIQPKSRKLRWWIGVSVLIIGGLTGYMYYLYARPVGSITVHKTNIILQASEPAMQWPATSEAAVGSVGLGVVAEKNTVQEPKPTASTAKLITALAILKKKPLLRGEQGPMITMTSHDKDLFESYYRQNGSVIATTNGQQLSQYQMLQGILLPSANNLADSLAIWAFGSLEKYAIAAQDLVESLGMKHTTVGIDASGFSPTTTSTARDLTVLGIAAIKHPVIADIVSQNKVVLPTGDNYNTTNWLLGTDGIIGIKTGNTDAAGGVFIFAASHQNNLIVGAVQGEPTVYDAIRTSHQLLLAARQNFKTTTAIHKDQIVAQFQSPWGGKVSAVTKNEIKLVSWGTGMPQPQLSLDAIEPPIRQGSIVGTITVGGYSSPVILKQSLQGPTWQWRVLGRK